MRPVIVLLMTLIAAALSPARAMTVGSAHDLAKYCQELERGSKGSGEHIRIPDTREALLCWGYMQAMQDVSVLAGEDGQRILGSCPPEQTTLLELIHAFVRYARSHRAELQGDTAVAVIRSLQQAFPCPKDKASARSGDTQ